MSLIGCLETKVKSKKKSSTAKSFGDPMSIICQRLRDVKKALVTLNKDHGNVRSIFHTARDSLNVVREKLMLDPRDPLLLSQERDCITILDRALLNEE